MSRVFPQVLRVLDETASVCSGGQGKQEGEVGRKAGGGREGEEGIVGL